MVYGFCISIIDFIVKHWCLAQLLATLPPANIMDWRQEFLPCNYVVSSPISRLLP